MEKKLCLSSNDKKIAGVCGGISEYFNFDSTLIRVIWALSTLVLQGIPVLIYIICWAVMPLEVDKF